MGDKDELLRRGREYVKQHGLTLGDKLGAGVHGMVFATESHCQKGQSAVQSAIKVFLREPDYQRERDVYLRLQERAVSTIGSCHVPQLLRHDDRLWVVEMTVVSRPFVLDFAGAFLDRAPDFSEEVIADWRLEKEEQFGPRWPEVQAILRVLESHGVFLLDVKPDNISWRD